MAVDTERDCSGYYVWFDTEFTSLDMERARLLQAAMVVTDRQLRRVAAPDRDLNLFFRLAEDAPCDPWVEEHLQPLLTRCRDGRDVVSVEEGDALLAARLDDLLHV